MITIKRTGPQDIQIATWREVNGKNEIFSVAFHSMRRLGESFAAFQKMADEHYLKLEKKGKQE